MTRTILIIDDEEDLLQLLQKTLSDEGHNIFTASSGPAGIDLAKKEKVDCILLDIMMPEMDGWEVLTILKSLPECSSIPVLLLTAKTDPQSKWEGWQQGAMDYITKPFTLADLKLRLREILIQLEGLRDGE